MTLLLPRFEKYLTLIGLNYQNLDGLNPATRYHTAFSTGGFWYLLCRWLHDGANEEPSEMTRFCCQFLGQ